MFAQPVIFRQHFYETTVGDFLTRLKAHVTFRFMHTNTWFTVHTNTWFIVHTNTWYTVHSNTRFFYHCYCYFAKRTMANRTASVSQKPVFSLLPNNRHFPFGLHLMPLFMAWCPIRLQLCLVLASEFPTKGGESAAKSCLMLKDVRRLIPASREWLRPN